MKSITMNIGYILKSVIALTTLYLICLFLDSHYTNHIAIYPASLSEYDSSHDSSIQFGSKHCGCPIPHLVPQDASDIKFEETTCGHRAFQRGAHQKVISYTYYQHTKTSPHVKLRYFKGIRYNLQNVTKLYPGWIMRLYFDIEREDYKTKEMLCELLCTYTNFDICKVDELPGTPRHNTKDVYPLNWRFFPTLDPQVSQWMNN